MSGAISSTSSLSTAVSTVISGSISSANSRIDSLSTAVGGGGTIAVQDEGVPKLTATTLNFKGAGVVAADDGGGVAGITITGGGGPDPGQSTSLSQISSSLSGAISSTTSLSTAVSTVDSNQSTSLSQISSSLSGAISSTSSLSTAVSTVDSNQSTSLSQISSSLSSEISSRTSGDTSLSTVISGSISTTLSTAASATASLSTAIGSGSAAWVELLNYDFAVTPASTKEIDVTGYHEILVVGAALVYNTTAIQRCIQVSVDGGGTWFTASGDYQDVGTTGVGSNNAAFFGHVTATASSRSFSIHIMENMGRNPVTAFIVTRAVHQVFIGSATSINRIRLMASAAASGTPSANNFTSGTLRVYGR